MSEFLLQARELTKDFPVSGNRRVHAVSGVSLEIRDGETLGLVGESGCGKSTLGRLLLRLIHPTSGEVLFRGQSITGMSEKAFHPLRRQMQLVFQDPYASLDPRMSVRDLIAEPIINWRLCDGREAVTPHQFSGGQRQRIGIARAIAVDPAFIVCDEPVSALDVSVQNQILNLLKALKSSRGLTYLFISHDLSVVRYLSDRICVMFLGKVCEIGPTEAVYRHPRHPYTRFLLDAVPLPDPSLRGKELRLLEGEPPSPTNPPPGCCFHTRCPHAQPRCAREAPPLRGIGEAQVACHFAEGF